VLAYREQELVGRCSDDALASAGRSGQRFAIAYASMLSQPSPGYQGHGSALMRHLAAAVADYDIACLETVRVVSD